MIALFAVLLTGAVAEANIATSCQATAISPQPCVLKPSQPVKPRGNPANWVTLEDYPSVDPSKLENGTVEFSLTVDREGKPIACRIVKTSVDETLSNHTCQLMMRRTRFCPATNRKAKPIVGTWKSRVRWIVPAE